jgi:hypothetical protein
MQAVMLNQVRGELVLEIVLKLVYIHKKMLCVFKVFIDFYVHVLLPL